MQRILILLTSMTCVLIVGPMVGQANAGTVWATWDGTSEEYGTRSARAEFTLVDNPELHPAGYYLKILLRNTASAAVEKPQQILTGVFFDLVQPLTFDLLEPSGSDVMVPQGSSVIAPGLPDGAGYPKSGPLEVGGEYGFRSDLSTGDGAIANYPEGLGKSAVSAVGMGDVIGRWDVFPGATYWPPDAPDGMAFGLVSALAATANKPLGELPLVQDTVEFYLRVGGGIPDVDAFDVENVGFNYGTDFDHHLANGTGTIPPIIPLPTASLLGGAGLGALGLIGRWKKRRRLQEAVA